MTTTYQRHTLRLVGMSHDIERTDYALAWLLRQAARAPVAFPAFRRYWLNRVAAYLA